MMARKHAGIAAVILLALFYATALNGLIEGGDAERYMIFGRSMLERGDLILLSHPNEPAGERYGPMYPALIAVSFAVFGYSVYAAKLASLVMAVAGVCATYLLVRELSDEKTGLLVGLLVAVNPQMLQYSHKIMTESTFLFFSLMGLFFTVKHAKNPGSGWSLPAAGFFIAASALTKSVGLVLFSAVVLSHLAGRRLGDALRTFLFFVLFMLPWYWRNMRAFNSPLHSNYGSALELSAYSGLGGVLRAASVFFANTLSWVVHAIPENVFPPLYLVNLKGYSVRLFLEARFSRLFGLLDNQIVVLLFAAFGVLVSAMVFCGMLKEKGGLFSERKLYFVFYVLFFIVFFVFALDPLLWSGEKASPRFVLPLLPLAFYYLIVGLRGVSDSQRLVYAMVVVIVASSLLVDGVLIMKARSGFYIPDIQMQWRAAEWARDNTGWDGVFLTPFSKGFYWISGRRVVDFESDEGITLSEAVGDYGVGYVLAAAGEERMGLDPDCLRVVYSTGEPVQLIYRVVCQGG